MKEPAPATEIQSRQSARHTEFGDLLYRYRTELNLSLNTLATRAYTSPSYLFRLEKGEAINPGRDFVVRLGMAMRLCFCRIDRLMIAAQYEPLLNKNDDEYLCSCALRAQPASG